jgi:dTDP-4-amino-4,6-dideoxygalactose transaminase
MKTIPFSPPRIDQLTIDAVSEVLRSGWITTGPKTRLLEDRITAYCGSGATLCLNSWTNAAELALRWFGIGPGDEVIVPVYTYAATANIVVHTGAKPIFVDCSTESFLCNADAIRRAITSRTKAIIPVDVGGLPADYAMINRIAEEASVFFVPASEEQRMLGRPLVLSDAAHSFGARYHGRVIGYQADICGFSFHAVKNFTTAEGGALTFNLPEPFSNPELKKEFSISGLHGQTRDALSKSQPGQWQYDIIEPGYKCNMTDIQAAIGLVEMDRYESETLPRRKEICLRYSEKLTPFAWANVPEFLNGEGESSYHLYMLRIRGFGEKQRNELIRFAAEKGVSLNVHFQPIPRLTYYRQLGVREEDYPTAMTQFSNEVSLPVYFDLSDDDIDRVCDAVVSGVEIIMKARV